MSKLFHFKQFSLSDEGCAMKIGTDAVLLGASTAAADCTYILDIGTGSGILALMLAQKSPAIIDAVEIDSMAAETAGKNFRSCLWAKRLKIYNQSLSEFVKVNTQNYDLIISNPPFFTDSLLSGNAKKNIAKHNVSLTYQELVKVATALLTANGILSVILPFEQQKIFSDICLLHHLKCSSITEIIPIPGKKANRVLMLWIKSENIIDCAVKSITIRKDVNTYSDDYLKLTKEYLLNS